MKRTLFLGLALVATLAFVSSAQADHCGPGGYYGNYGYRNYGYSNYGYSPYRYGYSSYRNYGYSPGYYGYHNHHHHNHYGNYGYRSGVRVYTPGFGLRLRY